MTPNFWCSLEVAAAELNLCFVIKGNPWWKRTFLPMVTIVVLHQWFLTRGTRTPWGYEALKQGVRTTKFFLGYTPWNLNPDMHVPKIEKVFSIVVSAVNFIRGHALNHRVFKVFCNEVGDQHCSFPHTNEVAIPCSSAYSCLSCAKKSSSFWDTEVVA